MWRYFDEELIQYIDAGDNLQIEYLENKKIATPGILKLYNSKWNENIDQDKAFFKALKLTNEIFELYIKDIIARVEAIDVVKKEIENSENEILILPKYIPYKDALKEKNNKKIKYVIYPSLREGYEIRTVVDEVKFPIELRGLPLKKLQETTKIVGFIYCDNNGKLCITKTIEAAKEIIKYIENIKNND